LGHQIGGAVDVVVASEVEPAGLDGVDESAPLGGGHRQDGRVRAELGVPDADDAGDSRDLDAVATVAAAVTALAEGRVSEGRLHTFGHYERPFRKSLMNS